MKKYSLLILATIFMFTLVSCDFYYETELEAYYYDKIKEEYEFDYGKSNFILATRGDKVYYLGDAYDAGLLEDDVIEDIYSKYLLVIDDIEDRYYS
jgi:hypothetical protein